ncbi:serine/threonine protein kinase [Streptacidiphilus pinicola]|uniref:Serine/threonine protein kinase n=1 Tax=Streptacidiphilus pinicola TaxID=2219663 RepID=A0A2X0ILE7_9ACTN|nr:serine/threonine-protein kinase [Streptacidiphilus pinicola]RAG84423.1 serine/threonine protein kinase [Streptacidiphilus pinicola]
MEPLGAGDPQWIGGYRLLGRLGAGGMGRVYLGRTPGGRTVAVKLVRSELADDPNFRARFRQEVEAARRVGEAAGPGRVWTAPVLDADTEGASPWVATGYVPGPSLDAAVRGSGALPDASVRALGIGLADALIAVHGVGLIHRDLKPSNVLLALDGPRLIDFGIARAMDTSRALTRSGFVVGSPGYMSPEQGEAGEGAYGPVGPAADVFALGGVLAFAATGTGPFGESVSAAVLLYRVIHEEPRLDAVADGDLRALIARCLAKQPAERPTPAEVREALGGAPAGRDPGMDSGTGAGTGSGTGPAMDAGWLPAPLVAAIGRRASELLDVESLNAEPVAGFGPPPVMPAPTPTPTPTPSRAPTPTPTDVVPDATVTPSPARAARSRSMLLSGVGLAVVAVGALVYGLTATHGGSPSGLGGGAGATGTPTQGTLPTTPPTTPPPTSPSSPLPTTPPSPPSPGPSSPNAIPAAFLGSWTGTITTQDGLQSETENVVLRPSAIGSENGTMANIGDAGLGVTVVCDGAWTLRTASADRITVEGRLIASYPTGLCTNTGEEALTLNSDGTLTLSITDPLSGNPSGRLHRVSPGG